MNDRKQLDWGKFIPYALTALSAVLGFYVSTVSNRIAVDSKIERLSSDIQTINTILVKFDSRFSSLEDNIKQILVISEKSTTRLDYLEMRVEKLEEKINK